jgi:helix-turn-helix protein
LANPRDKTPEQTEIDQLRRKVGQLERALGRKTYELEVAGELSRDWSVEVAKANPTDGTRMVAALASRELGRPVNRKRVQRVMRAHKLLQPSRWSRTSWW